MQSFERVLARVAERRVAEVVREADGLDEVLVQAQRARDRARDLRDLERVREPRAIQVALVDSRTPASCRRGGGRPSSGSRDRGRAGTPCASAGGSSA